MLEALVLLCLSVVPLWESSLSWTLCVCFGDELTECGCCHENWNQWDSSGVWNVISLLKEYIWSAVVEKHVRSVLPGCSAGLYSAFSRFSFQWQYLTIFLRASSICCKIFINEDCSFSRTRTGQFHIYDQTHLLWGHLISVTQFDERSVLKSSCEASSMHRPMI